MQARSISLDPTLLDQAASITLADIILQSSFAPFLSVGVYHEFDTRQSISYTLDHQLLKINPIKHQEMETNPQEGCQYAVVDINSDPIAVGSFSKVLNCYGIVKLGADDFSENGKRTTFKQGNYIIKWQYVWRSAKPIPSEALQTTTIKLTSLPSLENELNNSLLAGIRVKGATLIRDNKNKDICNSFTIMERYAGTDLFTFFNEGLSEEDSGNTDLFLKLAIEFLRVLAKFHAKGLVHHDLKPENIVAYIDSVTLFIQLKIVDMGASKLATVVTTSAGGSPEYAAPEVFEGKNTTRKADIFSAGKIIGDFFGVFPRNIPNMEVAYRYALEDHLEGIFENTPDLDDVHRKSTYSLLKQMIARDPRTRPYHPKILPVLEDIQLERKLATVKSDVQYCDDIKHANQIAQALRETLSILACNCQKKGDVTGLITSLDKNFDKALDEIADKPLVVQQFIDKLGLKFLEKLWAKGSVRTRSELRDEIKQLLVSLLGRFKRLNEAAIPKLKNEAKKLRSAELYELIGKYERTIGKLGQSEWTLDSLESWNNRLDKAHEIYVQCLKKVCEYADGSAKVSKLGKFAITSTYQADAIGDPKVQHGLRN